jgi:hypothetical protein
VRIKQTSSGSPSDTSNAAFTITTAGDITLDGFVDGGDLNVLLSNWNTSNATWPTGDLTGDGFVDGGDLNILLSNWNVRVAMAPTVVNDSYSAYTNHTLTVEPAGVLTNDASTEPMTAVVVTNPSHGSLVLNADGGFIYTPINGYTGSDSFTYKAGNSTGDSTIATVSITVNTPPAPTATSDSYLMYMNHTLTVSTDGVLANDVDSSQLTMTAIKVADPSHGILTLSSDGSFIYTPTVGYSGLDSYVYKAYNGFAYSNTAMVIISISEPTRILIDCGSSYLSSSTTPNADGRYWNNFTAYSGEPSVITSCTTALGGSSGVKLTRTTDFWFGGSSSYITAPINGWSVNAAKDYLCLSSTSATGTMEFLQLDTTGSKTYELTVFGSIVSSSTTLYTVVSSTTASQQMSCASNTTNWLTFSNLTPDANGRITLKVNLISGTRAPLNIIDMAIYGSGGATGATAGTAIKTTDAKATSGISTAKIATGAEGSTTLDVKINFQPANAVAPQGYLVDSGLPYCKTSDEYTYGWATDMSSCAVQRNSAASPDIRYDTAIMPVNGGTWEMAVPNGMYDVKIVAGDGGSTPSMQKFSIEGVPMTQVQTMADTGWCEETVTVVVTDGRLTITANPGSSICFVQITGK